MISQIDREDSKINDLNGVLWYDATVFDNANNNGTLEISINVTDVNDCKPAFKQPSYIVHINESTPDGTQIDLDIRFFQYPDFLFTFQF